MGKKKNITSCEVIKKNDAAMQQGSTTRKWLLLVIMAYTAFVFNTTEFIPIGLMTNIATDFGITEAHASLLITVYAWFVAIMSLPLMLAVGRLNFRTVLLCVVALFVVSHLLSAMATSFNLLLLARLGAATAHAIFWSIASPLVVHLAPEEKRQTALSMLVTGISLAIIAGMPLGRIIGLHLSWRITFVCIGAAALLAFVLFAFLFPPPVPNNQNASVKSVPQLLKTPIIKGLYIFTFVAVAAHYTGYSYIEPFMKQVVGMADDMTTFTLILFGLAGIGASVLFSRYFDGRRRLFLYIVSAGIALMLFLMRFTAVGPYVFMAHCMAWGLIFTMFNLVVEFEVIRNAPQATTVAVAIFSSIFNIGIGCGAVIGGAAQSRLPLEDIGFVGGVIAILSLLYVWRRLACRFNQ